MSKDIHVLTLHCSRCVSLATCTIWLQYVMGFVILQKSLGIKVLRPQSSHLTHRLCSFEMRHQVHCILDKITSKSLVCGVCHVSWSSFICFSTAWKPGHSEEDTSLTSGKLSWSFPETPPLPTFLTSPIACFFCSSSSCCSKLISSCRTSGFVL